MCLIDYSGRTRIGHIPRHRHQHRHPRDNPREDVDVGVVECGLIRARGTDSLGLLHALTMQHETT